MSLTRLDCSLCRGDEALDGASSYVVFNPRKAPLNLAFAGAVARSQGIGSQVSLRLALERYVEAVTESAHDSELSLESHEILERAFQETNSGVYEFGHQLSAGGRMGTALIAAYLTAGEVAVGRVGCGSGYLYREGQLFPFFEGQPGQDGLLGQRSFVEVELSSTPVEALDTLCIFDRVLDPTQESRLIERVSEIDSGVVTPQLAKEICSDVLGVAAGCSALGFSLIACIGPEALYLGSSLAQDLVSSLHESPPERS